MKKEIKYKKSRDQFGYIDFIDERGLTSKGQRVSKMHKELANVVKNFSDELKTLKARIMRNSSIIVTDSNYDQIDEIIYLTRRMLKEVNYPFQEELLVRSSTFEKVYEFSLPNTQIPFDEDNQHKIHEAIEFLNSPDQILIHPRLSEDSLKKEMIAARFNSSTQGLSLEIAKGGITHISSIEKAKTFLKANNFNQELDIKIIREDKSFEISKKLINKYFMILEFLSPLIEKDIISNEDRNKPVVYEFRIIERDGLSHFILNDYEVV